MLNIWQTALVTRLDDNFSFHIMSSLALDYRISREDPSNFCLVLSQTHFLSECLDYSIIFFLQLHYYASAFSTDEIVLCDC